ncbi:hypothetical protein LCGC14_2278490 [marine sediment metagenome]|uniref:Uncharacterized protein n=1 Tax=marine sediment metagenome TaxID=412755 RepID=A0A0F9FPZ3_9ZZZZ
MKPKFEVGQWVWAFLDPAEECSSIICVYSRIYSITIRCSTIIYEIEEDIYDPVVNWDKVFEEHLFGSDPEMFEEIKVRKKYLIEKKQKIERTEKETF